MAQKAYTNYLTVHPTGIVEVSGKTDSGRELSMYILENELEILHKALNFAEKNNTQLGHAFYHVKNGYPDRCDMC